MKAHQLMSHLKHNTRWLFLLHLTADYADTRVEIYYTRIHMPITAASFASSNDCQLLCFFIYIFLRRENIPYFKKCFVQLVSVSTQSTPYNRRAGTSAKHLHFVHLGNVSGNFLKILVVQTIYCMTSAQNSHNAEARISYHERHRLIHI